MSLRQIDHVQLAMPPGREAEARAFYQGLLGLAEVAKPANLAGRGGCWFEQGALKVHLGVEAAFQPARKAHPAFIVEGLADLRRRLRDAGCSLTEDAPLPGLDRVFVADPFGNRLELMEPGNLPTPSARDAPLRAPLAALVTGGAQRLGRAIALVLAGAGHPVAVHCRQSEAEAQALVAEIQACGGQAAVLVADLADEAATMGLIGRASAALGPVGVLVNNASNFERDEWDTVDRASWDAHLEPNLRAPFVLTQAFARALPPGVEGNVVNLLDQRVWSLTPHFVSYTVSKAALWALTQSLALALAPRIRVNAVGPGPALPSPRQSAEQFAEQCAATPLGRGTSPEEVARAVLALLALPAVTGQMLALDGGQHLQWSPAKGGVVE